MKYIKTIDGSNTLYSKKYKQNFHSQKEGALNEALSKYVIPSFELCDEKNEINILDICFGLGYNTFATIYYCKLHNIKTKINFYSPELDEQLILSLGNFSYPKEFDIIKNIINEVSKNKYYKDEQFEINIYISNARDYIKTLNNIHLVYQDAFSSDVNKELWTKEYFFDIKNILNKNAIISTYSIATPVRLAMWENDLNIYQHILSNNKKISIASTFYIYNDIFKYINMNKKKINNPSAKSYID